LTKLSEIASGRTPETIERALAAAKEELGMDVAFVSEFTRQEMVFLKLVGEAESFGLREGESIPLDNTFCRLLIEGLLPNVIPDAGTDERVGHLDVVGAARIGSYVGVPIRFSDDRLYGTLCALSHSPDHSLRERDAQFMRVLARLVAEQLERERSRRREAAARARAHERKMIGRELHDRAAHTMGVVHQSLQLYEALRERDPKKAAEKLELAKQMTVEAIERTRNLSRMLRSEEAGEELRTALSKLLRDTVPPGMARELSVAGDDEAVPAEVREQLFLVLREAVRNAVSHSGASKMSVAVSVDGERIAGVVEDDGRGFVPGTVEGGESGGLAYMAERASLLGGACSVYSVPGGGTRVEASFPVNGAMCSAKAATNEPSERRSTRMSGSDSSST
jgi:signal transduction histidine kinase